MARPLTRIRLVLPSLKDAPEALAARMADAFAVHGIQVRQQVYGSPSDGAPRADVALWLPDADGGAPAPDARAAAARVHAAVVVEPSSSARHLGRYDAILVPHESLRDGVRAALKKASAREVPVVVARLAGSPLLARDADKALHGVGGRRVVLLDVRADIDDIERVIVQLALRSQASALVLLAPRDDRARGRVRALCERHAVDAWLATGADGFAQSIASADVFIGQPSWDELLLAALHQTAVGWLGDGPRALVDTLRALKVIDEIPGVLQLAAALDKRLQDVGALAAKGIALREALFGPERELIDVLAALEPLPQGALAAAVWEPVGPHASKLSGDALVVDARDAHAPAEPSRGQKIEDALEALKQKIASS